MTPAMTQPGRLLIVDDERNIRLILQQILRDEGYDAEIAESGADALALVKTMRPDLILMDQNMPDMDGFETMERIRTIFPDQTIIFLTAHGSISRAVDAMKRGAYDYLTKPFDNDELLMVIRRALEHIRLSSEVTELRRQLADKYRFENIIGESPVMQHLFEQMRRVAGTDATVLVQGESGTGKELVARALHYHSPRSDKPFVAVNCGAIPATLVESEIFGHEQGAFTDARETRIGHFERADGGTLFLDEVGELPMDAQVKLLRVLEDRAVTRIGGTKSIPVDVRIISATNKDLDGAVAQSRFRLDLLYRLNVFTLTAPPLRDRKEDIPLLAEYFLKRYNQKLQLAVRDISQGAIDCLIRHNWPGNVRDLENAMQSAMIMANRGVVNRDALPLRVRGYPQEDQEVTESDIDLDGQVRKLTARLERDLIMQTLKKHGGNRSRTAEALHISRKTLFNKMKEYRIGDTEM